MNCLIDKAGSKKKREVGKMSRGVDSQLIADRLSAEIRSQVGITTAVHALYVIRDTVEITDII